MVFIIIPSSPQRLVGCRALALFYLIGLLVLMLQPLISAAIDANASYNFSMGKPLRANNLSDTINSSSAFLNKEAKTSSHQEFIPYTVPPLNYPDVLNRHLPAVGPFEDPNNPIPFTLQLKANKVNQICNPEDLAHILAKLLNVYCIIPGYCGSYQMPHLGANSTNLTEFKANDIIWKSYPVGLDQIFVRLLAKLPQNYTTDSGLTKVMVVGHDDLNNNKSVQYVPTSSLQNIISRSTDIIEASTMCKVINPMSSLYTYYYWVMPIMAGTLFFLLLGSIILIYHIWSPGIEKNLSYKLLGEKD